MVEKKVNPIDRHEDSDNKIVSPLSPLESLPETNKPNDPEDQDSIFNQNYFRIIGALLSIRSGAQSLKKELERIKGKILSKEGFSEDKIIRIYQDNKEIISRKFQKINVSLDDSPELDSRCADEIMHIRNYWKCVEYNWPDFSNNGKIHLEDLQKCCECIEELIFHCDIITIPLRINRHLEEYHAGQKLNFYESFSDEVCDEKQGYRIIEYLSRFPRYIDGYVDLKNGVIYKADSPKKQKYSCFRIIIIIIVGAIIFPAVLSYMSENLLDNSIDFFNCYLQLLIVYTFIVAGAASHIGLDAVKQIRSGDSNSLRALNDWFLWINIKESAIIAGIVIVWIGYMGLMISLQKIDLFTAFIVGYSVDSFADIFLLRFETTVSTKVSDIKKNLE